MGTQWGAQRQWRKCTVTAIESASASAKDDTDTSKNLNTIASDETDKSNEEPQPQDVEMSDETDADKRWISETSTKVHLLTLKKQFLEGAIVKGDLNDIKSRIEEIRSLIRDLEIVEIQLHPDGDNLSKTIDDIERSITIIDAAMKIDWSFKSTSENSVDESIKIKPMKLPTFSGNPEDFPAFWEQYTAVVDNNSKFSQVSKHRLLITECLKGNALKAVMGYTPSSENYPRVLSLIKERFGDPAKLVSHFYQKLEKISPALEASQQRIVYDDICKILANLRSLGVTTDEEYLKEKILQKFSRTTLKWVWITLKGNLVNGPSSSNTSSTGSVTHTAISKSSVSQLMNALAEIVIRDDDINHYTTHEKETTSKKNVSKASTTLVGSTTNTVLKNCVFCNLRHNSEDCRKFGTMKKRKERLVALRKCLLCGEGNHFANSCQSHTKCSHCKNEKHSKIMCIAYILTSKGKSNEGKSIIINIDAFSSVSRPINASDLIGTFLETFICEIKGTNNIYLSIRGILDGGSNKSFISEHLVKKLHLKTGRKLLAHLCNFGSKKIICQNSSEVTITIKNRNQEEKSFIVQTIGCITGDAVSSPSPSCVKQVLPNNLFYADPSIFENSEKSFDLLLGIDVYNKLMNLTQIKTLKCGIVLKGSFFGWIPSGSLENNEVEMLPNTLNESPSSSLCNETALIQTSSSEIRRNIINDKKLEDLCALNWSLEVLGIRSKELENVEDKIIEPFRKTVQMENERYVVRWPWKTENPSLPSNYRVSMARLRGTIEKNTIENLKECDKNFKEQLSLGIIEHAPSTSPFLKHYIPWKATFRKNKIRVVYDASAKTSIGKSLNDMMHAGPKLIGDLINLLINFRIHRVGITADIEKAFLMVGLNEVDRDVTRFLWVKDLNAPLTFENLVIYRFTRTCFGVISSPFLLNIVLQDHLTLENKYLSMSRKCFYVDNLLLSLPTTIEAINLHNTVKPHLLKGGFNLRDWTSNDSNFVNSVPGTLPIDSEPLSILGLSWNRVLDTFSINSSKNPESPSQLITKRSLLSYVNGIYDPLGLVTPATLPLRLLLQECWKIKFGWDEIQPASIQAQWLKLYSESKDTISTSFPRRYWNFEETGEITLHVFCDASKNAYACCAYLTYSDTKNGNYTSSLIMSKSRIAPSSSKLSIPRLELLGVLIGKRLGKYLLINLKLSIQRLIIWTDATTVIHWLKSSSVQAKFIEERTREIRESLEWSSPVVNREFCVKYVPTECNPADLATRGVKSEKLFNSSLWWHGPDWLPYPQLWPSPPLDVGQFSSNLICVEAVLLINTSLTTDRFLPDSFEIRFSSWNKYVRLYGMILRFCADKLNIPNFDSNTDTFQRGERALIRALQFKYFHTELVNLKKDIQPNKQLYLFLDEYNIIRCKGRLSNASFPWETIYPILLPRNSPLTILYIRKIHVENMHMGCSHVLAKIREKFWIVKGRAKVNSVLHRCSTCKKWTGGSFQLPPMPPLPWFRVTEMSPFLHTGVDYFGPLNCIRDDGTTITSVHVALFVCLVTRAVHLELSNNLTADEFLMAFERFTNRRGVPLFVFSDNGNNFKFVQRLVGSEVHILNKNLRNKFNDNNIRWKFAPPNAPWYRGSVERIVGVIKPCLKKAFGRKQILNYVSLNTTLTGVENIVNSRPLTYLSEETLLPLTPNHFLRHRTVNAQNVSEVSSFRIPKASRKNIIGQWNQTSAIVEDFWCAFRSLYLLSLRSEYTALHKHEKGSVAFPPKKNDIVLIHHPSAPRCDWAIGKILKLDKRQASAEVFSNGSTLLKPINQLYPFEFSDRPKEELKLDETSPMDCSN